MEFMISGRNVAVSDRFREYAEEKIGKVEALGDKVQRVEARVTKQGNVRDADSALTVEITVTGRGPIVRAEATSGDKFAAFDLAYGKLLERLRRASDRRKVHHGRHAPVPVRVATADLGPVSTSEPLYAQVAAAAEERANDENAQNTAEEDATGDCPVLIRRKVFPGAPMSLDDAVDNMEMVGHDFYLFVDSATGAPSVVYRRRGWTYGVITLDSKCADGAEEPREETRGYRVAETPVDDRATA
ncbi:MULTISPECIES: ribosome hibernation-promoting factor, HPF/YfiA family [unclassified Arthrobacter]|uniref:ribosome hibernation-promoting factor, HPF/YfiA family n=1 Tax=unclassified Arthrobacter TaxID=235627 RepID=UPI002107D9F1|nr:MULTISPECIES: ribosome-associated translation inhibitor RaiA [unclassified Arthrobacter]MCQ1945405.1 ribosome-associated translation inhibitor RaiA [Arthrobacter sp. zg-Y1116]MCQ1985351.1 ribosome-associated translation inhibitor RaiA [Arthrobacter sp. zg-Y844]MCQ1994934.1 ribosome-associated translation inhibitor RaiA [Arthrobacter sp. zg-Y1171]UWX81004.1 ribosome-associated translation inhibitor RaiA [Arthrobacter sp. zg-Y1171]